MEGVLSGFLRLESVATPHRPEHSVKDHLLLEADVQSAMALMSKRADSLPLPSNSPIRVQVSRISLATECDCLKFGEISNPHAETSSNLLQGFTSS